MKKLACILVVVLIMIPFASFAENNLASMSFDELVALKNRIMAELVERGELKEVKVPAGTYTVGDQIPAGEYSVALAKGGILAAVIVNEYEDIYAVTEEDGIGRLVLEKGDTVEISSTVIFTKFAGLGF